MKQILKETAETVVAFSLSVVLIPKAIKYLEKGVEQIATAFAKKIG